MTFPTDKRTLSIWHFGVLALLCVLAFWPMFRNGFVWDDPSFIVQNQAIRGFWPVARFFQVNGSGLSSSLTLDRPVMVFSLALDYALWKLNPFGYHLTNLLLHLLCVFGVAWLAFWLSRSREAAFLAGAFFALHPGHAEGVIAFAGRSDLLACLFVLLGFWGYVRYLRAEGGRKALFYAGSLTSFLIACFSKETGLALLGLLVVYQVVGGGDSKIKNQKSKIIRLVPFVLVGLLYWVQRGKALGGQFATTTWWGGSPYKNYLMAFEVYAQYLRLLFFPLSLSPLHTVPVPGGLWDFRVLLGIALLFGSLGVVVWALKRHFWTGFLIFWFLIGLVPIANFIPIPGSVVIMAEHRLYLPAVGACILGGWGAWVIYRRWSGWVRQVWAGLVAMILVLFGVRTFLWSFPWKTEESIARVIMATDLQSPFGYYGLGVFLEKTGRVHEAEALYRQAIRLKSDYVEAHNNLGLALGEQGKTDEAIAEYRVALSLNPYYAEAHNNLGISFGIQGKNKEAIAEYREAIRLNPDYVEALENMVGTLDIQGRRKEAREFLLRAEKLEKRPEWVERIKNRLAEPK